MPSEIPLTEFLFRIGERNRARSPAFCFIIGAGASVQSGIPTGAQLAERWLREIYVMRMGQNPSVDQLDKWIKSKPVEQIPDLTLENIPENYSAIFEARFGGDSFVAERTINDLMEGREPSFGYSILARILALTQHNTVTTTNFDHLVASALAIYQQTLGKMLWRGEGMPHGLEFVKESPKILKIHGEAGFNTKNLGQEIAIIGDDWKKILIPLFQGQIPIVIGYGGNDKGFMEFLASFKKSETSKPGLFWCYRSADGKPPSSDRILRVMESFDGVFVAVPDFDELMLLLGDAFEISPIEHDIRKRQENQLAAWRRNFEEVADNLRKFLPTGASIGPEVFQCVARRAVEKMLPPPEEREWWEWHASARNAGSPEGAKTEYELGLKWIPHSAPLMACYAHFLSRKDPTSKDVAKLVARSKEIIEQHDPKSPEVLSVLHQFGRISQLANDLEEAADYFDKVLAGRRMVLGTAHPDTQASIQNLAEVFLQLHRDEKAESLYSEYNDLLRDRFGEDHNYYKADCQRLAKIRLEIRNSGTVHTVPAHRRRPKKQKRIVIHQPHFLPWLGYFNKLVNCSHFVVLDNVNFRERYFQNRTRIRNSHFEFTWLTLPTHASMHDLLLDVKISEPDWNKHIMESLRHAYRRGHYFDETWASLANWFPSLSSELVSLNVALIQSVLKYLGCEQIEVSLGRNHEMEYAELLEGYSISERTNELRRTLKVATICRSTGANELILGEGGGRECHNLDLLRRYGIQIVQQRFIDGFAGYKDVNRQNVEGVSIVDALFLVGRKQTLDLLQKSWAPHLG
jgi:hypothetical protein